MNRPPPPLACIGEFRLVDCVGAGGMGEVYRAVHARTGQLAAVKFLHNSGGGSDAAFLARFRHEAQVLASLRHPNIAAFLDWSECDGRPCLVMEWVEGPTLAERIAACSGRGMALEEALAIFEGVVAAICHVHERGIVHRDIKSANVKISAQGVKLLDFGIAKSAEAPQLTVAGNVIGTLQSLAPEQIKNGAADARSDIWSLGVLFYEMLAAKPPFESASLGELCEKIVRAEWVPLQKLRPDLPRETHLILARCLQKKPGDRFQSARELADALASLRANSLKSSVSKPSVPKSSAPKIARNQKSLFWVAGGAVCLLAGIVLMARGIGNVPVAIATPTAIALSPVETESGNPANTNLGASQTITVDVFEGGEQTRVFFNGESVGHAPYQFRAREGERVEITLKRPNFRTQRETIDVSSSKTVYSFSLEPLEP